MSRYHDDSVPASDPVPITLSRQKFYELEVPRNAEHIHADVIDDHLSFGDSRAAVVVSTNPLLVAAYTEDLDCVVLLRFQGSLVQQYRLKVGSRLLTINTYFRDPPLASDLTPGPESYDQWYNYNPFIADFLTDDMPIVERRKAEISEDEWSRARTQGERALRGQPPPIREGHPFVSWVPRATVQRLGLHPSPPPMIPRGGGWDRPGAGVEPPNNSLKLGLIALGLLALSLGLAVLAPGESGAGLRPLLAGLGVVVGLAGWIWLIAMAIEQSRGWAFLLLCFGWIAALFFVAINARRWKDFIVPAVLLYGGMALFVVASPSEAGRTPKKQGKRDRQPVATLTEELESPSKPTAEELQAQAYVDFHARLRATVSAAERLRLAKQWREQGFHAVDGAWRDLIESLAAGPSSEALETLQLAETDALDPPLTDVVHVLPLVPNGVRHELLARFRGASGDEREACLAALAESEDLNHPAILEAYMVLGVVTSYRVSRMIRASGLAWTEDPLLRDAVHARASEKPGFVNALLKHDDPTVREYACGLTEFLAGDGDEKLGKVLPLLRDGWAEVRGAAADALAKLGNARASWGLARALEREQEPSVRERLLGAIRALDSKPTLSLVRRLQRRESTTDQRAAAMAFRAFSPDLAAAGLSEALAAKDEAVIKAALETLIVLAANEASMLAPCRKAVLNLSPDGALGELRTKALELLEGE